MLKPLAGEFRWSTPQQNHRGSFNLLKFNFLKLTLECCINKRLVILFMKNDWLSPHMGEEKTCDTLAMKDHETTQMQIVMAEKDN